MEAYRKKVKFRIVILMIALLVFVAILLYNQFDASASLKNSLSFSFQCGFSAAGSVVLAYSLIKYRRALTIRRTTSA